jgi:hypothetical protein
MLGLVAQELRSSYLKGSELIDYIDFQHMHKSKVVEDAEQYGSVRSEARRSR